MKLNILKVVFLAASILAFGNPGIFAQSNETAQDKEQKPGVSTSNGTEDLQKTGEDLFKASTDMLSIVGKAGLQTEQDLNKALDSSQTKTISNQESPSIVSHVPAPKEVEAYLLKFKDITDQNAPSAEEKMAVIMSKVTGKMDQKVLDSLIAKCSISVAQINKLNPPGECKDIHQTGIKFYQLNKELYALMQKSMQGDLSDAQRSKNLSQEISETGGRLDSLRRQLHQKYNLGRL